MTRNDVILALMRANLFKGDWTLDDDSYDTMSADFIVEAWSAWVATLPDELTEVVEMGGGKSMRCPQWIAEVYDCDNIARDFAIFLDRCMAVDAIRTQRERGNAAGGCFAFSRDGTARHMANWFVDHDSIARVFDAARCVIRSLTVAEIPTVTAGESA
jgi:hypothetical protein